MISFVTFVHIIICLLLVVAILMQSGRGGGLTEGFASAESIFGAKTSAFMVKTTTVLGSIFLATCLSLAFLSSQKGKSLMAGKVTAAASTASVPREGKPSTVTPEKPVEAAAVPTPEASTTTTPAQQNQDSSRAP